MSSWLATRPPTIATPSGQRSSAPGPVPNASGRPPSNAASVVIVIGRNLSRHASTIASAGVRPRVRSASSAKSIIMIAFFLTMPISRMMPISDITLSSIPQAIRATSAPSPALGSVEMIVSGWTKLS